MQWMLIGIKLAGAYAVFVIYFLLRRRGLSERQEERVPDVLFYSCTFLVVFTALRYVASAWVAVSLGFAGLALFLLGFLCKDKMFRLGGFILFGITLARIVFIDLSGLPIIYKIVSFIVLGLVFLAVSFFYSNYSGGKRDGS